VHSAFRDLVAYRLSAELADGLHQAVRKWPASERSLGDQLVRAADSIGANIAEASGRWHRTDERRFLRIARGSLYETEHWMHTAERRGLLQPGSTDQLTEIAKTLNGLIAKHVRS
jgi:four helix bundle protein